MDVHCSTCGEPWDSWHILHDAIYDTALTRHDCAAWDRLDRKEQLSPRYRAVFRDAGYEFGHTLMHILGCPACPRDAEASAERTAVKHAIEDMLGDDLDAIAATFNDHHL